MAMTSPSLVVCPGASRQSRESKEGPDKAGKGEAKGVSSQRSSAGKQLTRRRVTYAHHTEHMYVHDSAGGDMASIHDPCEGRPKVQYPALYYDNPWLMKNQKHRQKATHRLPCCKDRLQAFSGRCLGNPSLAFMSRVGKAGAKRAASRVIAGFHQRGNRTGRFWATLGVTSRRF